MYSVISTKSSKADALLGKSSRAENILGAVRSKEVTRADTNLRGSSTTPQRTPVVHSKMQLPKTSRHNRAVLQVAVASGRATVQEAKDGQKKDSWIPAVASPPPAKAHCSGDMPVLVTLCDFFTPRSIWWPVAIVDGRASCSWFATRKKNEDTYATFRLQPFPMEEQSNSINSSAYISHSSP